MNAEEIENTKTAYRKWSRRWWAVPIFLLAAAQAPAEPFAALKTVPVPKPENLAEFVRNESALVQLGKALFWDMQVGSDAVQACASCHFAAGADPRATNQLNPGTLGGDNNFNTGGTPSNPATLDGPNDTLTSGDFPFTRFNTLPPFGAPPFNAANRVFDKNDVASSMGVFRTDFLDVQAGRAVDLCRNVADPVFNKNGLNTRRVEPRNTPTFHNSVFNFRNFWDGRAQFEFNGVNPFGSRDPDACVWKVNTQTLQAECIKVEIKNCSQCSQAVGPPRSFFEMSCNGRPFPEIGVKLTNSTIVPLNQQKVCWNDSVFGPGPGRPSIANSTTDCSKTGLKKSYAALIQEAFRPEFWNNPGPLPLNPGSEISNDLAPGNTPVVNNQKYTQLQANMSLFFGLSVGMYMATQVSDDTPADKFAAAGRPTTGPNSLLLTARQKLGLQVFEGEGVLPPDGVTDGLCANCHGGAETTNASVRNVANQHLERMQMGFRPTDGNACDPSATGIDGRCIAVYDNGFYNIGARPTSDDVGVGGLDPFGNPLSETRFCQQRVGTANPCQPEITCIDERPEEGIFCPDPATPAGAGTAFCAAQFPPAPGEPRRCPLKGPNEFPPNGELIAVDGNFKTPHLRNLLLTGPYFHNGGKSTLEQVVRAYNHGLDFRDTNQKDLDPDIEANLGLTEAEVTALVDFLACGLLDDRVRKQKAPFDHPQILVPVGNAADSKQDIPAVGAGGVTTKLKSFLDLDPQPGLGKVSKNCGA